MDEILLPDGTTRKLGNNPGAPSSVAMLSPFPIAVVPRSEWKARVDAMLPGFDSPYLPPTHDQNGVGQCNADATVGAVESQRMKQGLPHIQLSAADLYSQINGGSDRGSTLEDGIRAAMSAGIGTAATCGTVWKRGNWKGPAPADERARFKVLEAYLCPSFDACFTAVLEGFDLISGIWWYDNYTPDPQGWLPAPRGNRGGHAVHGFRPTYRNFGGQIEWGIVHQNSWGSGWGIGGKAVFPERCYGTHDIGGWWAVRTVTDEGGSVPQTA